MTTTLSFSFQHRPLVPFAHDYAHGDQEDWHQHDFILGRLFPLRKTSRWQERAAGWLKRYGAVTLLLSWAPVVGDLLCLLAGWMRISWGPVLFFLCLGKALRYIAIAAATLQGMTWWH